MTKGLQPFALLKTKRKRRVPLKGIENSGSFGWDEKIS
jgi:hypothetical protein